MLIEIKFFESELASDIETLEKYFNLIENSISAEYKNYNKYLDKKLKTLKEDDAQDFYETHIDEIFKLSEVMPSYHRTSIFLLIYNFLEHNLNKLCVIHENFAKNDLSHKDLTGKGIHRSKLYLTKIMKVTKAFRDNRWNTFLFYNELRNTLVHNGGLVNTQNIKLSNKIESNPGVILSSYRTILFERSLIECFLSNIKEFFDLLFTEIRIQNNTRV